jgi:hypothetical protein
MDKPKTTAKDFFLWAGAMVAFYWSVIAYIYLVFDYINYAFPNALSYYPADPYQSGISYEMASIIVLLPIYMFVMRFIRRDIAVDPSRADIWARRWAIILTLFVAGITAAIDFITLLTAFLNGQDLTTAFLLKVAVVFLVAAGVFMHFIADLRGYWTLYPAKKMYVTIAVGILAVVTIVAGFFIVGTPAQARLARFDAQKVMDLQNIQYQVTYYWQAKQKLPASLADLTNSPSYGAVPVDPQTQAEYEYSATGALSFKLCATFNTESRGTELGSGYTYPERVVPTPAGDKAMRADAWQHTSGPVCFERTIDPSFYPPIK